ncbi:right-handed parallel beta-helix repeat-containing protein [Brevundimonas aurifodinae]|uniref:Right-handed parallel beta-helix repeat-containing protein n=1 Tax=Brevundimonas aurifodinae TaxID=1508312 RepID=A0ABV1NS61_9CAUL
MSWIALAATLVAGPATAPCPADVLAELTATTDPAPFHLTCFATLPPGRSVTRPIVIEGEEGSGAGLDCRGGSLGRPGVASTTRTPTLSIRSRLDGDGWSRPRGVRLADCTLHGNARIWGLGADGRIEELRASSRAPGHTGRAQAAAPTDILFHRITFIATGSIPLYIGPGVTGVRVDEGRFTGRSVSTAIYLDAESAGTVVQGVDFDIATAREQIAVDGSARNRLVDNRFRRSDRGGVFLYRNCGEDGVIRHRAPTDNTITGNRFEGVSWLWPRAVVLGSREGGRRYCGDDAGWPFGSSADDGDNAARNVVRGNTVDYRLWPF